ncbi:MAG: hypothetical protein QOJ76_3186 [Acidobacteriota bacterium]|jgi:hypothetical protein|nr:hypothetical protein [Acidobacteriota bacterium]
MADKQTPSGNHQATGSRSPRPSSSDDVVEFAQNYFSADFRNPERLDCPPRAALRERVLSGEMPDETLRKHLFGCSECFGEYRAALRSRQASAILQPGSSPWQGLLQSLTLRKVPLLAGAFSLLFVCLLGAYLWRQGRQESAAHRLDAEPPTVSTAPAATPRQASTPPTVETLPPPLNSTNQPSAGTSNRAGDVTKRKPSFTRPAAPRQRQSTPTQTTRPTFKERDEIARLASVRIDLDELTASRGMDEDNAGRRIIKLTRARQRLLLVLPEGSLKGLYGISILSPSGEALVYAGARSRDGKTVAAIMNTQRLAPGRYSLRIAPPKEGADLYPLLIGDEKPVH